MSKPKKTSAAPTKSAVKSKPVGKGDHVYLIDGSGYIFRAFHALPPLTRPSDGLPVGAVHGFCQMLFKLIEDSKSDVQPSHVAVIFDHSAKTFRNEIYGDYKANRPPPPEDLIPQFPLIRDATRAFNLACIEQKGYEADDLIATYAKEAVAAGAEVTIVSSDKDLMQLIEPGVMMLDTMKNNRRIRDEQVFEKFGVAPNRVVDVQALWGDSTDNVPGVPGIGQKTAAQLITEYGDLDTVLARAGEIKQNKRRENLIEFADQARVSRELVKLKDDVPVGVPLAEAALQELEPDTLLGFMREMEFNTLTARVAERLGVDAPAPLTRSVGSSVARNRSGEKAGKEGQGDSSGPGDVVTHWQALALSTPIDRNGYETVTTIEQLMAWVDKAREAGRVAFDTETDSLDAMQANLVGLSMAVTLGEACYVPLGHGKGDGLDLEGAGATEQIPLRAALDAIKPMLEDSSVLKIGQNLKYDILVLLRYGIRLTPLDDTMLLSFVLDAGTGGHGMDEIAMRWLGHKCISFKEVAGTGKSQVTFDKVAIDKATAYAAEDADVTLRLWMMLKSRLVAEHMTTVYETLERPLVDVLA
ncbi:MAG: 5'-3' exonuclease H3TH domain-containing protein, partial [Hyphomicrobiaceae bacterium]